MYKIASKAERCCDLNLVNDWIENKIHTVKG